MFIEPVQLEGFEEATSKTRRAGWRPVETRLWAAERKGNRAALRLLPAIPKESPDALLPSRPTRPVLRASPERGRRRWCPGRIRRATTGQYWTPSPSGWKSARVLVPCSRKCDWVLFLRAVHSHRLQTWSCFCFVSLVARSRAPTSKRSEIDWSPWFN